MKKRLVAYIFLALPLLAGCRGDGEDSGLSLEISYGGGYSPISSGTYTLNPTADGGSVVLRYKEIDYSGATRGFEQTYPRGELEGLYLTLVENDVWELPSSDLRTATDQHTYTVTVTGGGREHTFSVYGPRLHPDGRYWNIIGAVLELGAERAAAEVPAEFRLYMRSAGGLSVFEYVEHTVISGPDRSHLVVEEKERSGGVKTREWEVTLAAAEELYLALTANGFWELGDSRAAETMVTDIPTYTFTLEAGDRSHTFTVYAPVFDPDPRYGEIARAVYAFAGEAGSD